MISSLLGVYQGIAGQYRFLGMLNDAHQARLELINHLGPTTASPAEMANLARTEAALEMQAQYAQVMFAAHQAMREAAAKQLKKNLEIV